MSTSEKHPNTIRQGGPGASHENAKAPKDPKKPGAAPKDGRERSHSSSGGGEQDSHHSHDDRRK
jgi:hypothetical protein